MKIGNIEVNTPVFLGPMAGVTDWAYRTTCARLGAGVTVTEMVSSRALVYQDKKTPGSQFPYVSDADSRFRQRQSYSHLWNGW